MRKIKAYKYTNSAYCNPWSFRLGTLYDYRKEETHGSSIGDRGEGSHRLEYQADIPYERIQKSLFERQPFPVCYVKGEDQGQCFFALTCPDLLVFSAVLERNDGLYDEFADKDCCIEIPDFEKFSHYLMRNLGLPIDKWEIQECTYGLRRWTEDYRTVPPLPFWKDLRYRSQKEIRLCIQLYSDPVSPVTITGSASDLRMLRVHARPQKKRKKTSF